VDAARAAGVERRAREVRPQRLLGVARRRDGVRLAGKVALVTGGSRGIGRALALGFAAEGATVHVNHFDEGPAAAPPGGLELRYDVSDVGQIRAMFARLDRLDVLVNCAGITGWGSIFDVDEEAWDRVLDTNLKGTFFCSVEAARLMRTGGGSIVNVSSVVAERGMRNLAPYAASKGGIDALTRQLAIELAPYGIRVNTFAPGATNVDRNLADDPSYLETWGPLIPLGRVAEPDEMVGPAVFLASDESAHVTGQRFFVDGGWTVVGRYPDAYLDAAADANRR
jgi:NAD(P)-dependent dehydrogenase (short-subunit alcohol dehydrogenase family)